MKAYILDKKNLIFETFGQFNITNTLKIIDELQFKRKQFTLTKFMSGSVLNFLSFLIKKLLSRGIFPFIYIIHFIATITSRCKTDAQLNFNRDRGA